MTFNWRHSAGAFALSVALLASTGGQMVEAKPVETGQLLIKDRPKISAEKGKSDTIKPDLPSVDKGKSATIPPPTDDVAPTERGIKDNGVKGCTGCGITGREAAPPPVDDGAAPPSVDYEEKGKGQHMEKPGRPLTERRAHNGPGGTSPSTAKNKSGWIIPTLGAVTAAALAAILASGNNNDNPTSP